MGDVRYLIRVFGTLFGILDVSCPKFSMMANKQREAYGMICTIALIIMETGLWKPSVLATYMVGYNIYRTIHS